MVYILTYKENSDEKCTAESAIFGSEAEVIREMKSAFNSMKESFGGEFSEEEDELKHMEEQRWAAVSDTSAHIQVGIDSYDWNITQDERYSPANKDPGNKRYIVSGCTKNGENGDMIPTTPRIFSDEEEAKGYLRQRYEDELKELDLDDNEACNEEGDSIPGGCLESDGTCAQIWNITDCSFGALENVAIFILTEVAAEAKSATDAKSMSDVIQKLKGAAEKMEDSANAHQDQGCYNAAWEHGYVKATYDAIKAIQQ